MNAEYLLKRSIMNDNGYSIEEDKFINEKLNSTFMCVDIDKMSFEQFNFIFKECFPRK